VRVGPEVRALTHLLPHHRCWHRPAAAAVPLLPQRMHGSTASSSTPHCQRCCCCGAHAPTLLAAAAAAAAVRHSSGQVGRRYCCCYCCCCYSGCCWWGAPLAAPSSACQRGCRGQSLRPRCCCHRRRQASDEAARTRPPLLRLPQEEVRGHGETPAADALSCLSGGAALRGQPERCPHHCSLLRLKQPAVMTALQWICRLFQRCCCHCAQSPSRVGGEGM
jgi:hypothetical protein